MTVRLNDEQLFLIGVVVELQVPLATASFFLFSFVHNFILVCIKRRCTCVSLCLHFSIVMAISATGSDCEI